MEALTLIWFLSCIWALFFMPWCAIHKIELPTALFAVLCPGLNTAFAAYRTYCWVKDGLILILLKIFLESKRFFVYLYMEIKKELI